MGLISKIVCIFTSLLALSVPALAESDAVLLKDVVATVEQGYGALKDLQAAFTQRSTIASVSKEQKSSGELYLKKQSGGASMFRFNYVKPKQQIVSDGKTVWYYQPENRQVIMSDMSAVFAGGGGLALTYLTGMGQISRDFTIKFTGEKKDAKGNYLLELVPRQQGQAVAKLHLVVSAPAVEEFIKSGAPREPFPIVSSILFDTLGNRTAIDFSKIRVNKGLGNSQFTFKIPAGVEVIRQGMK